MEEKEGCLRQDGADAKGAGSNVDAKFGGGGVEGSALVQAVQSFFCEQISMPTHCCDAIDAHL